VDAIEVAADGEAAQETRAGVFLRSDERSLLLGGAMCPDVRASLPLFSLLPVRALGFPDFLG
jgi:hypothetical protein